MNEFMNEIRILNRVNIGLILVMGIFIAVYAYYSLRYIANVEASIKNAYKKFIEFKGTIDARVTALEQKINHIELLVSKKIDGSK